MIHHEKYDKDCTHTHTRIYIHTYIYIYVHALVGRIFRNAFTKIKFLTSVYNPVIPKNRLRLSSFI